MDNPNEEKQEDKQDAPKNAIADAILTMAVEQLRTSRQNKRGRFTEIKENEDLYFNVLTEKNIRNPFNECFPFMAGFVDHLKAKIDDDSTLSFSYTAEADGKKAQKIQSFYDKVSKSIEPHDCWDLKHRHAKTNAIFSGVATYKYFAESSPYKSHLEVISHYDFHNEPRGGAQIENHLFCGQDNIFKTEEELKEGESYDKDQVAKLVKQYADNGWKDNSDFENTRNNRFSALGQQPETNNYVGQGVIKLVEWYTTYKGKRYYMLFNEQAKVWVRCMPLIELFPDNLWPYITWHTNEDPDIFWSKAPADDARAVAKIINKFINQELYYRQKNIYGQRGYDAEMFPNVAALADWRPDGLVPVDTKAGTRSIASGIYEFRAGTISGTLDLVTWLEQFTGKQIGYTSSSAGQSENDKKVGVFQGEIQQIDELINVKNKSYRMALSQIGLHFKQGLEQHLDTEESVMIMGGKGVEWQKISKEDLETESELKIQPVGGSSELRLKEIEKNRKLTALSIVQTVNPQWKDRQMLLLNGFTEQDVKEAFSSDSFEERELMFEAAEAEKAIVSGENPPLNRGATAGFMQHIIDFEKNTNDLDDATRARLLTYSDAHLGIAVENMNRNVKEKMATRAKINLSTGMVRGGGIMPVNGQGGISEENPNSPGEIPGAGVGRPNIPVGAGF